MHFPISHWHSPSPEQAPVVDSSSVICPGTSWKMCPAWSEALTLQTIVVAWTTLTPRLWSSRSNKDGILPLNLRTGSADGMTTNRDCTRVDTLKEIVISEWSSALDMSASELSLRPRGQTNPFWAQSLSLEILDPDVLPNYPNTPTFSDSARVRTTLPRLSSRVILLLGKSRPMKKALE